MSEIYRYIYHGSVLELRMAIENGDDIKCRYEHGRTSLMVALLGGANKSNKREVVDILLEAGADVNAKDNDGSSVLHIAVQASASKQIVQKLLDFKADHTLVDKDDSTACQLAFKLNNAKLGHLLFFHELKSKDHGNHEIHYHAFHGRLDELRNVLEQREDLINLRNINGLTPLMMALLGDTDKKLKGEVIDFLLSRDADVNIRNNDGDSTLHIAVKASMRKSISRKFVRKLLDHGADNKMVDGKGKTASKLAFEVGNLKLGELLLDPIFKESMDIVKSNLHNVAYHGRKDLLMQLIRAGEDVNCPNETGQTPLMFALLGDTSIKKKYDIIDTLLKMGADVNMKDYAGNSTLHVAVKATRYRFISKKLIERLLKQGADYNMVDKKGKTASELAFEAGNGALCTLIQSFDRESHCVTKTGLIRAFCLRIPPARVFHFRKSTKSRNYAHQYNVSPGSSKSVDSINLIIDDDCTKYEEVTYDNNKNYLQVKQNENNPKQESEIILRRGSFSLENGTSVFPPQLLAGLPNGRSSCEENVSDFNTGRDNPIEKQCNEKSLYKVGSNELIEHEKTCDTKIYVNEAELHREISNIIKANTVLPDDDEKTIARSMIEETV